jgi:hypothetical protein
VRGVHLADPAVNRVEGRPITRWDVETGAHIRELDIVELATEVGRWPAGVRATVLEVFADAALVEIADDRGHTLETMSLPWAALRPVRVADQRRLAV